MSKREHCCFYLCHSIHTWTLPCSIVVLYRAPWSPLYSPFTIPFVSCLLLCIVCCFIAYSQSPTHCCCTPRTNPQLHPTQEANRPLPPFTTNTSSHDTSLLVTCTKEGALIRLGGMLRVYIWDKNHGEIGIKNIHKAEKDTRRKGNRINSFKSL